MTQTELAPPAAAAGQVTEQQPRDPMVRLGRLFDPGTLTPLHEPDDSGVVAAVGRIDDARVVAYCTDATKMGGALGAAGSRHIVHAIDAAIRDRVPVIGLWHSGGARLAEGVESMDGVGRMFAAMTRASGKVPQISVVLGPAAGAAAYGPALTDLVIMCETGYVFVTGPEVVRGVTGEDVDMAELGGTDVHGRRSGVVHVVVPSEEAAYRRARRITGFFTRPGLFDFPALAEPTDLRAHLPESARRAYDVKPLLRGILDEDPAGSDDALEEIQARWAPNIVIGLGRLGGRSIGVIANNPLRMGGCLDSLSAEKAARFVRMCDAFAIPLLVVVDVPGYLPGTGQEWNGVVRRGAKLLHAFAEAVVPRVTLVTRKSYGGAYIAMNSRSLGATAVYAWPGAEVAVMGSEAAVGILYRKVLAKVSGPERDALLRQCVAEYEMESGGVRKALALGVVDEVIEPRETRLRLARAIASAPGGRGHHGNIPL